jgi:hypothetical protein
MSRQRKARRRSLFVCAELHLDYTNDQLTDLMHQLREQRLTGAQVTAVCVIAGFDDDPRELGEVPEVRAFCRRLVDAGFISWLDVSTSIPALRNPKLSGIGMMAGLGAYEVWGMAEGFIGKAGRYDMPLARLEQFQTALAEANRKADERLRE